MNKAFTLVEIMIVVSLVVILVLFAAPNVLRSRLIANEGTALANLKAINNACQLYHMNQDKYPDSLDVLGDSDPPYLDSTLASGQKQSYQFVYSLVSNDEFSVNANPTSTGLLKGRYFYMDESGIIRGKSDGPAGPDDEVVK
jgi:prepilin-type N-terminal cleavage/methylation domain-containing protein